MNWYWARLRDNLASHFFKFAHGDKLPTQRGETSNKTLTIIVEVFCRPNSALSRQLDYLHLIVIFEVESELTFGMECPKAGPVNSSKGKIRIG